MGKSRWVTVAFFLALWVLDAPCVLSGQTPETEPPEEAPPARDPWEILQSTPGVLVDRIDIDGIPERCGCAAPAPPYVEAGAAVGEGFPGVDEAIFTGNLMERFSLRGIFTLSGERPDGEPLSRRGTNEWRASGFTLGGYGSEAANFVDGVRGFGAEVGGPLIVDRLWIWGGAGLHDLERFVLGGQREEQSVAGGRLKLNAQIGESASFALVASRGGSEGRGAGAAPDRAPETTWDEDGGETIWAVEGTVIASANFYSIASAGHEDRRLEDDPQTSAAGRIGADGVARGGWYAWDEERRQRHARLSSALFASTGAVSHEVVFGAGWLRRDEERALMPSGPVVVAGSVFGLLEPLALTELWRAGKSDVRMETLALWAQDSLTISRWMARFGLHADRQDLGLAGGPRPWTLAPRLQLNRDLKDGAAQVWVALGRFASRLGPGAAWHVDGDAAVALPSLFSDLDGDLFPDVGEPVRPLPGDDFDLLRPGVDPDIVDPRLRPEITDEAVLGIESALTADFKIGLRAIWRRTSDLLEERLLVRDLATGEVFVAASTDWIPTTRLAGTLPDGTPYDVPVWDLRPGLLWTGGSLLTNGDRRQEDFGLSLTWRKRLAGNWMAHGHVLWRDGDRGLGSEFRRFDDPTNLLGGGDDEGEPVEETASGRPYETPRFEAARWSFEATGLVRLGQGGYSLLATVKGRQGHPLPYFRQAVRERAGIVSVQVTDHPDAFRTDDLLTVDAALERELTLGAATFSLAFQALNVFNNGTVLRRELDLGTGRAGFADETLSSRTLRVELRLWWR